MRTSPMNRLMKEASVKSGVILFRGSGNDEQLSYAASAECVQAQRSTLLSEATNTADEHRAQGPH